MSTSVFRTRSILIAALLVAGSSVALVLMAPSAERILAEISHFWSSRYDQLFSEDTALYVVGIALVIAVEVPLLGYRASSLYRLIHPSRSTVWDLFCYLGRVLGYLGLVIFIFSCGTASFIPHLLRHVVPAGALALSNPLVQAVWVFVAIDFLNYWMHRLQHAVPFWWEVHKLHHSATEFNVITTARGHPVDDALRLIFMAAPVALLGATVDQFILVKLMFNLHAGLTHSMLPWRFGWLGRWILVPPVTHRIHHSELPEHFDRNFASVLIIWDRLFGAWYGGALLNPTVGVADNSYNRVSLLSDLIEGTERFATALAPIRVRGLPVSAAGDRGSP